MQSSTSKHLATTTTSCFKRLRARKSVLPRSYSSATGTSSSSSTSTSTTPPILSSLLLTRSPLLTPSPTPFSTSYHAYTSSLHRALSNPPPVDFYFKKGSLAHRRFERAEAERDEVFGGGGGVGGGGVQRRSSEDGDEVQVQAEEGVVLNTRSDKVDEWEKVERMGERNVYLVVKDRRTGEWGVPKGKVGDKEALHEAATRHIHQNLGIDMDMWLVTRQPVGVIGGGKPKEVRGEGDNGATGNMTFIFKSHILAGAPRPLPEGAYDAVAWLTKEEVREVVRDEEWDGLEGVLS